MKSALHASPTTYFMPWLQLAWAATAKVDASKTVENFIVRSVREKRNMVKEKEIKKSNYQTDL